MTSIAQKLTERVSEIFISHNLPAELGAVRVSDRPDLAQFQCNGAMAAAKHAKKNPREVAAMIVAELEKDGAFSKIEIAGPGFINLNITDEFLAGHVTALISDEALGVQKHDQSETIVLDYGGPNIAKAMHVGHLRASIIGDAVRRIYKFAGYNTIGDVHMGDWGTPMGMILSYLEREGSDEPITMEKLEKIYPIAAQECKSDEARMAEAREATRKLQNGEEPQTSTWKQFIEVSIAGMKKNFDALGVHFDEWKGEADAHPFIEKMIEDLKAQGLAVEDDGALIVPVSEETDKKELPPLILLKSDGAVLYGTTDLATIVERMQSHNPTKIVYVVDQRQSLHFEQVFRAAKKSNISGNAELIHAGFGTMNGADGKPFKTRAGGVMKLEDLIAMGLEKAQARLEEADLAKGASDEERADIAHKVAIAAIKFADLQNQRQSDYVFDLDRMTAFEGKTGPYLLYQAVRIQSLLKKAQDQGVNASSDIVIEEESQSLSLLLAEFPDHFEGALRNYTPHVLCDYVFKLAQAFSSFYSNCHILSEENEVFKGSRLALCELTLRQITLILSLLGIAVPTRM